MCFDKCCFYFLFYRNEWEKILELVNCKIISETRNEDMIAYLLR